MAVAPKGQVIGSSGYVIRCFEGRLTTSRPEVHLVNPSPHLYCSDHGLVIPDGLAHALAMDTDVTPADLERELG